MPESDKHRQSVKRQLKPAPQRPGQDVHCPRFKSEVHFVIPGSMPEIEILRIRTTDVSQPFLDPNSMQQS
ncbi:hypothetical protein FOYG_06244 [Fusarium oxysporum NRRL 32931]|uniref:Uncharacterized protein n=1 Tax=Fusarium oxysporum NRRL 32931 TaxID=660029 RepID=W9IJS9_FUSOX|nr:hypothetical protein FOYG_06244 [Fusarium oxysporum NRRL 32931]